MTPTPLAASQKTGPSTCPSWWEVLHVMKSSGCRLQDYVPIMEWALTWIEGGDGTRSQHSWLFQFFPPRALPLVSRCFSIMVATYNIEYVLNWKKWVHILGKVVKNNQWPMCLHIYPFSVFQSHVAGPHTLWVFTVCNLSILLILTYLILTNQMRWEYYRPPFMGKETEAQINKNYLWKITRIWIQLSKPSTCTLHICCAVSFPVWGHGRWWCPWLGWEVRRSMCVEGAVGGGCFGHV